LVVFSSYKVKERTTYLAETRAWMGNATWKQLDRASAEVLVGEKILESTIPSEDYRSSR
jgi:hypothetical protein